MDTPQGETPEPTEGTDTGSVTGSRNEDLPTETPVQQPEPVRTEDNRAADQGGPGHTSPQMGEGTQPPPVTTEGNQAADQGGPGHTSRWQGDTETSDES